RSALRRTPHCRHQKSLCERRLLRAVCPQQLQRCEVCRGSTATTVQPRSSALYSTLALRLKNGQLCMRRLACRCLTLFFPCFLRLRMSFRFSSTIVAPISTAPTICL